MYILLDYDNAWKPTSGDINSAELSLLYQKIIEKMDEIYPVAGLETRRINIRLYGGWDCNSTQSPHSQILQTIIDNSDFKPFVYQNGPKHTFLNSELAYSLISLRHFSFRNTYRKSGASREKIQFIDSFECAHSNCPFLTIKEILDRGGICTHEDCKKKLKGLFVKHHQKLVDAMLTTDLLHLAQTEEAVVLISDDDDFWPSIRHALAFTKCNIFHFYNGYNRELYVDNRMPRYTQVSFAGE